MANKKRRPLPKNKIIPAKRQMFPDGAEREYTRLLSALFHKITKAITPKLKALYKELEQQTRTDSRFDERFDFEGWLRDKVVEIAGDADDVVTPYQLNKLLSRVSNIVQNTSVRGWMNIVQDAMGIPLDGEYYDEVLAEAKDAWVSRNVSFIKSVPEQMLDKVKETILWGYNTKQPYVNVYRRLQKLGMDYKTARRIARDQIGTLSSQMTRLEHESMGVEEYIWKTRRDDRVRECHASLEGTVQRWDDPPEMWYRTLNGIVYTGRFCHPSEDFGCRCTAIPIFDKDKVSQSRGAKYVEDKTSKRTVPRRRRA